MRVENLRWLTTYMEIEPGYYWVKPDGGTWLITFIGWPGFILKPGSEDVFEPGPCEFCPDRIEEPKEELK